MAGIPGSESSATGRPDLAIPRTATTHPDRGWSDRLATVPREDTHRTSKLNGELILSCLPFASCFSRYLNVFCFNLVNLIEFPIMEAIKVNRECLDLLFKLFKLCLCCLEMCYVSRI